MRVNRDYAQGVTLVQLPQLFTVYYIGMSAKSSSVVW